jgi:hypothetical protein
MSAKENFSAKSKAREKVLRAKLAYTLIASDRREQV